MFKKLIVLMVWMICLVPAHAASRVLGDDTTINGFTFKEDTALEYDLKSGEVDNGILAAEAKVGDVVVPAGSKIYFQGGQLRRVELSKNVFFHGIEFTGTLSFVGSCLERGKLSHDVEIGGIKFTSFTDNSDIVFYASGKVKEGYLAEDTKINGLVFKKKAVVETMLGLGSWRSGTLFDENGAVMLSVLAYPQKINGIKFMGQIEFYKGGKVKEGVLAGDDPVIHGFSSVTGSRISFYWSGNIESFFSKASLEFNGIKFKPLSEITLYESGKIKHGLLAEETKIGGAILAANDGDDTGCTHYIDSTSFYENGNVAMGRLASSPQKVDGIYFKGIIGFSPAGKPYGLLPWDQEINGQQFKADDVIRIDDQGKPVKDNNRWMFY